MLALFAVIHLYIIHVFCQRKRKYYKVKHISAVGGKKSQTTYMYIYIIHTSCIIIDHILFPFYSQAKLEEERIKFEIEMKEKLKEQLKEKEEVLLKKLDSEQKKLLNEKMSVETNLQKQMESKLEEKDKRQEEELMKQKAELEKVIQAKELKQKVLETQLKETQHASEKQKEGMLKAREDVLANFTDLLETELQCSICNELFIQVSFLVHQIDNLIIFCQMHCYFHQT